MAFSFPQFIPKENILIINPPRERETMESMVKFLYPPPSNLFISAMSVASVVSLANAGFSEIRGKNMKYSKFSIADGKERKISGRNGMLLAYTPAFLAAVASFGLVPDEGLKVLLIKSAVTIHFLKRIFEIN
ncbi:conserved hypothetical protein [Ricinus communis]|uniref:Uncharacterized protein n=1 Tax=Ricinus communis TaxID=3988 RepID=B9RL40_RICCO|nr:conserved hypothetical protein [Ricinus communis]